MVVIGHEGIGEDVDQALVGILAIQLYKGPSFIFRQQVPPVRGAGIVREVEEELKSSVVVFVGEDAHLVYTPIEYVVRLTGHQRLLAPHASIIKDRPL